MSTVQHEPIPFFRYDHLFGSRRSEFLDALLPVLERGAFILQAEVGAFEAAMAAYTGAGHAIGVANATDALQMIMQASGIGPGDEVIAPSHTFVASIAAIRATGATPVLVDIADDHLIDPAAIERAVTSRTRAVMPVQLNGRTCNMDRVQAVADRHGLLVVEDSSQGAGSRFRGRHAGTFGMGGVFSFYPAKTLGCFGDGGLIVTSDDALAESLRLMRDHGRSMHGGGVRIWGRNSRLDNVQAAVLLVQLAHLDEDITRRRAIAALYSEILEGVPELLLPPAPDSDPDHYDAFQNYEMEAERRDALREYLQGLGIATIIQWGGQAVHQFPALELRADLPRTELLFERALMLPMNTSVTDDEATFIGESIRAFYGV
jgi:dTDP-4-amino-4,6-dideoxygalactose transaminase